MCVCELTCDNPGSAGLDVVRASENGMDIVFKQNQQKLDWSLAAKTCLAIGNLCPGELVSITDHNEEVGNVCCESLCRTPALLPNQDLTSR